MINLLPQEEKELLREERVIRQIIILAMAGLVFFAGASLALLAIKIYLGGQITSHRIILASKEEELAALESQAIEKEIRSFNGLLTRTDSFYSEQPFLNDYLIELYRAFSSGLYLTNLSYQEENGQISFSGYAPTREALLIFKENLGKSDYWQEIFFPVQTWLKSKDIFFSASLQIKE